MQRSIAAVLLLCIILNNGVPLTAAAGDPRAAFARALAAESSVLGYFSIATLPLKVMTALLGQDGSPGNTIRKPLSRHERKQKQERKAPPEGLLADPVRMEIAEQPAVCPGFAASHAVPDAAGSGDSQRHSGLCLDFLCVFLLAYLVLLARSNLPAGMITLSVGAYARDPGLSFRPGILFSGRLA